MGSVWTFPPEVPLFSSRAIADAHNAAMALRMNNPELSDLENAAGLECRRNHPGASDDKVDAISHPVGLVRLSNQWEEAMDSVTTGLPAEGTWWECVSRGLPRVDDVAAESVRHFGDYMNSLVPVYQVVADPVRRSKSVKWHAFVEAERMFGRADAMCRDDVLVAGDDHTKPIEPVRRNGRGGEQRDLPPSI